MPTADNQGSALVTNRLLDSTTRSTSGTTETTIVTGYTIDSYELIGGNKFRIFIKGQFQAANAAHTITFRLKLGGVTILTSTAVQAGSTAVTTFNGQIDITGTGEQSQRVGLSIIGKSTVATAAPTYCVNNYGTSAIDMRQPRALTVTAQFSSAPTTALSIFDATSEVL